MKFIFLLMALFAFVLSDGEVGNPYYDNYGCQIPRGKTICCWTNWLNCCWPPNGKKKCTEVDTLCCKHKEYDMSEGEYVYTFHGGVDRE